MLTLAKVFEFLKRNIKYILVAVLILFIFFQVRSCQNSAKLYDSLSQFKGAIEARDQELSSKDQELALMKRRHEDRIIELNKTIDSSIEAIVSLQVQDKQKRQKIEELKAQYSTLGTCEEKLNNALAQIQELEYSYSLIYKKNEEQDKIIFSLTAKYESERSLRLQTEVDRDLWRLQAQTQKELNLGLEKKIKKQKTVSTIKDIGWVLTVILLGAKILL